MKHDENCRCYTCSVAWAQARLPREQEHSKTGVCTLAPKRKHQDVGLCRACVEQGLFDAMIDGAG
jgi:hypothetical protein